MSLPCLGSYALVLYRVNHGRGKPVFHERFLSGYAGDHHWIVVTPDNDQYMEDLNPLGTPDVDTVRFLTVHGEVPVGLGDVQIYGFQNPVPYAAGRQWVHQGQVLALAEQQRMGLAAPAVVPLMAPEYELQIVAGAGAA